MAKKDKFKQMQQGGGALSSFQSMAEQATTIAAIEKQAALPAAPTDNSGTAPAIQATTSNAGVQPTTNQPSPRQGGAGQSDTDMPLFMRLPNPQIPVREYNLVSQYCNTFSNMTRQDFVELAIIEKLHAEHLMPDDEFTARQNEIRSRPRRGQRKGTKQTSK